MDANLIETAPKDGTLIHVWRDGVPPQLMGWDAKRKAWVGTALTAMGSVKTIWDRSADQPTHWRV